MRIEGQLLAKSAVAELTKMVNNRRNLGKWDDAPVPSEGGDRKIDCAQPLYSKAELEPLLDACQVVFWTRDCGTDASDLGLDLESLAELAKAAINNGTYKGSVWCEGRKAGNFAACDAYEVKRDWWCEAAHKYLPVTYYIKFAISKAGTAVLFVSCHTSN
jgi:hypothetical protein